MALGNNLTKKTDDEKSQELQGEVAIEDTISTKNSEDDEASSEDQTQEESSHQFCVFKSQGEEYAIPINLIKEVVPFPNIAPVSQMPSYIKGMTNVRGNIFGVLDLGHFFSNDTNQATENKYLLVLEHEEFQMAIAIPDVPDTLMVNEGMIEQLSASRLKSVMGQKYLKGIIKKDRRMIILFDILGLISSDKFTVTV